MLGERDLSEIKKRMRARADNFRKGGRAMATTGWDYPFDDLVELCGYLIDIESRITEIESRLRNTDSN